jgi:hypothetical protein
MAQDGERAKLREMENEQLDGQHTRGVVGFISVSDINISCSKSRICIIEAHSIQNPNPNISS